MSKSHSLFTGFTLLLASSTFTSSAAFACPGPFSESSIFFDEQDVTAGVDGQAIAKVTITNLTQAFVGRARVDRVIKGQIDQETITVRVHAPSYCTRGFGVGASGVVVGSLERDDQGDVMLVAMEESNHRRAARRKAHALPPWPY